MIRAVGTISFFTLLSRVLGFVRDIVIARGFGSGMGADAFFVALKLPNFLRRLFAEGAFSTAFVPVFADYLGRGDPARAREAALTVFSALAAVLMVIVAAGELLMPLLIRIIAPGFADDPAKLALTIDLTRITFPYILFISLVSLAGGILNSHRRFAVPAATPMLLNVTLILGALLLSPHLEQPAVGLAIGVFAGGVAQLALQIPALRAIGMRPGWAWNPRHPAIKRILTLMGPSVLGVSVAQINLLFDIFLASFLPAGSISYLYYADRLVEFPLGLIGIAMGTAILPALSAKAAAGDRAGLDRDLRFGLGLVLFLNLPATVGLVVLREPILSLLFERGAFDEQTTQLAAQALLAYGLGLLAFSTIKVAAPAFYAMKETRTPVRAAVIALIANMVLNVILMFPLKHAGLALATTLSAYLNAGLLLRYLRARCDFHLGMPFVHSLLRTGLAAGAMGLFLYGARERFWSPDLGDGERLLVLLPMIAAAILLFLAAAWLLRAPEMQALARAFGRRRSARRAAAEPDQKPPPS